MRCKFFIQVKLRNLSVKKTIAIQSRLTRLEENVGFLVNGSRVVENWIAEEYVLNSVSKKLTTWSWQLQ